MVMYRRVIVRTCFSAIVLMLAAFGGLAVAQPERDYPSERVIVTDDARRPQEVAYSRDLTVSRAIIRTGGYSDFGSKRIYLVRAGQVTRVDIRAILERPSEDIPLKPWDIIVIGTTLSSRR